jgi:hypothetical protein
VALDQARDSVVPAFTALVAERQQSVLSLLLKVGQSSFRDNPAGYMVEQLRHVILD